MRRVHREAHLVGRIGWLRAAVLGANDGIICANYSERGLIDERVSLLVHRPSKRRHKLPLASEIPRGERRMKSCKAHGLTG